MENGPKLPDETCGMLTVHFKEPPRVLLKEDLQEPRGSFRQTRAEDARRPPGIGGGGESTRTPESYPRQTQFAPRNHLRIYSNNVGALMGEWRRPPGLTVTGLSRL